jgi:predicted nuclease of predicted toxin-antitoxin system
VKVLLDENLPHRLRLLLPEHEVFTVRYLGWNQLQNGALMREASSAGFDAFITMDAGIPHQQNLVNLPVAVIVLHAETNAIEHLRPLAPLVLDLLSKPLTRQVHYVGR